MISLFQLYIVLIVPHKKCGYKGKACVHIFDGILRPLTSVRAIISENKTKMERTKLLKKSLKWFTGTILIFSQKYNIPIV
jgi:hypothetical protein